MAESSRFLRISVRRCKSAKENPLFFMTKSSHCRFRALFAFTIIVLSVSVLSLAYFTRTAATEELENAVPSANDSLVDIPAVERRLLAPDGAIIDEFGRTVVISGDTAAVAAPTHNSNGMLDRGAVYVYVRNGDNWTFQQKLVASDGIAGDRFGA